MHSMNFSWIDSNDSGATQKLKSFIVNFLNQPDDREYPDLCQLPDLTERTLLENLKARFEKNHIYTYVGSILIAVNPFKVIPLYQPKLNSVYSKSVDRLSDLPPHIYAIATASYSQMLNKQQNQTVVISGESGSGKTVSTSLLLHHLSSLSQKSYCISTGIEDTLLSAGPVMEAFGNALTQHNDNSSRFGKFIQVIYREDGMVNGAIVQKYLLEKSRIVSQSDNERNYHAFYYLIAGASPKEREELRLTRVCDYFYLNQTKQQYDIGYRNSRKEVDGFIRLKKSMEIVGFSPDKQHKVFSVLAAVLHLGNIEFERKSIYHNDDFVQIKNTSVVTFISQLLGLKPRTLLNALTSKRTRAPRGETLHFCYRLHDAIATRDAMAKCLYAALFDWIVMRINQALLSKRDNKDLNRRYIGILDIFGFEDFGGQNYFEQFCINYANEHLHFYFNQHVFKYEQEEYKREGIVWKDITFADNIDCLRLIEERPSGLLCILDDQCNLSGATNQSMLTTFANQHRNHPLFEMPPSFKDAFIIKHYAGKVKYQITDFREKNSDLMRPDIVGVLKSSSSTFVRELVGTDPLAMFRWQILRAFFKAYFIFSKLREAYSAKARVAIRTLTSYYSIHNNNQIHGANQLSVPHHVQNYNMRSPLSCMKHGEDKQPCANNLKEMILQKADKVIQKRTNQRLNKIPSFRDRPEKSISLLLTLKSLTNHRGTSHLTRSTSSKRTPTVTAQFQVSLHQLLDTLSRANPYFVRCIKSNKEKKAEHFDDVCVLLQLRYTGMLETVRIRQSGYSVRLLYTEFAQQYRILLKQGTKSGPEDIKAFLDKMRLNRENYQMGRTKVFMRETEKVNLDMILHEEILRRIVCLQRWVRVWFARRSYLKKRSALRDQIALRNCPTNSSWNVTRTTEFTDSNDIIITEVQELQSMDMFVFKKIYFMDEQKRASSKESIIDIAFKQALKEFRLNLLSTYSVASSEGPLRIGYKDLIDHFEQVILNVCQQERAYESFPVTMGVNAFRGYLDEFRTLASRKGFDKLVSTNRKRENPFMRRANKRRMKQVVERQGHKMFMTIANIPIVCEICTSLVKLGSRILVCNDCKLTCHKKCLAKVVVSCRDNNLIQQGKKVFGAPLERLVSKEERLPAVLEQLMTAIEMKGLYVEGLYRKSATQSKINELKQKLEEDRLNVDLNNYGVHVWTAVLKSFFREMPEPLMTFELYDEFLWATAIQDVQERIQVIFSHISKLNRANYDLLERLTFHLARVAIVEHANRMSASSLAIVFAPCILRTDRVMRAQDSFGDIRKQTICLECIITERMKQVRETLVDIDILDRATHTAEAQLSNIRRSAASIRSIRQDAESDESQVEEARLTLQIESLQSEKSHLTNMLPSFRMASNCSDDELIDGGRDERDHMDHFGGEMIKYGNGNRLDVQGCGLRQPPPSPPQMQQVQRDATGDNSDPTTMNVCIV